MRTFTINLRNGIAIIQELLSDKVPWEDQEGSAVWSADKVRPVARELARLAKAKLTKDKLLAAVQKASRKLNKVLQPDIEPLPSLKVE